MTEPSLAIVLLTVLAVGYGAAAHTLKLPHRVARILLTVSAYAAPTFLAWSPALLLAAVVLAGCRLATHQRGETAVFRFAFEHGPQGLIAATLVLIVATSPSSGLAEALTPWWQKFFDANVWSYLAAILIVTQVGAEFVATVLNPRRPLGVPDEDTADRSGRGRTIGVLERLLILILVTMDQWGGIAFVIAAKSLARFKEFDDREFAEYYLVGTLTSALFAIAVGLPLTFR